MAKTVPIEEMIKPWMVALPGSAAAKAPAVKPRADGGTIKMNANENPYGCSPKVQQALSKCKPHLYPDPAQTELRKLISEYVGVDAGSIVVGHGGAQIATLVIRLFVGPGDEVINCVPTFELFRFETQMCGGTIVEVIRDKNFAVDVSAVKAAITDKTKLVVLTNPNNPTGNLMPKKDILEIVDTGVPVLVDEAYYEFCGETVVPLVSQYENLIVLRTFSKWAGLAGLRVGYGIFPANLVGYAMKTKGPFNITQAAVIAVRETFNDIDYVRNNVKAIIAERKRLTAELSKLGFLKPYPSWGNFILCWVLDGKASQIQQELGSKGIMITHPGSSLLKDCIRITVGKPEHNDALVKALQEVY